jgi:riboflavin biosynthesis pyrimidine reductase
MLNDVDLPVLIATTNVGVKRLAERGYTLVEKRQRGHRHFVEVFSHSGMMMSWLRRAGAQKKLSHVRHLCVGSIDMVRLVRRLHAAPYNVRFLDVTAGGKTISEMLYLGLVDEYRVTISGSCSTAAIVFVLMFFLTQQQTNRSTDWQQEFAW